MRKNSLETLVWVTCIGCVITVLILTGCSQKERSGSNKAEEVIDTTYDLSKIKLMLRTKKIWQRTESGSENVIGFRKQCNDSVFCPSLTFIPTLNNGILSLDDEAVADLFFTQLRSAQYENVQRNKMYHVINEELTNSEVLCCEFSFRTKGVNILSTSCLVRSEKTVLVTFSTNKQTEVHERELLELISGLSDE